MHLTENELWLLLMLAQNELELAQASLPPRKPRLLTRLIAKLTNELENAT